MNVNSITSFVFLAIASLISLTVHEFAHAFVAYKLGDPTADRAGRLSLNPLHHLDIFGTLCLIFFHFGWAKPVPINARYFKKPKRDFALCALAGPVSNLILAFVFSFLHMVFLTVMVKTGVSSEFGINIYVYTAEFLSYFVLLNLGLALFNLIPLPPLDGSRVAYSLLPPKAYFGIMRYEKIIYYVLLAWLFLGDYLASALLSITGATGGAVYVIARILDLSGLISEGVYRLAVLMYDMWGLLPFLVK